MKFLRKVHICSNCCLSETEIIGYIVFLFTKSGNPKYCDKKGQGHLVAH